MTRARRDRIGDEHVAPEVRFVGKAARVYVDGGRYRPTLLQALRQYVDTRPAGDWKVSVVLRAVAGEDRELSFAAEIEQPVAGDLLAIVDEHRIESL